jgi:hypothetical protein
MLQKLKQFKMEVETSGMLIPDSAQKLKISDTTRNPEVS